MPKEFKNMPQYQSRDGCVYLYNREEEMWYKFCPVDKLPADIKAQVYDTIAVAELLKDSVK